jgi:DNA-binding response OmpR family regulator
MDKRAELNLSILLLASDSPMRGALRDALQHAGLLVVTASDLGEAVDRIKEMPPDLLIVRPYISSMSGAEAAEYLRTKRPGLTVLIVAGFLDDERIRTQDAVENFHVFPKPYTADELVGKVREVLASLR